MAQATSKPRLLRTALLGGAIVAWQIYEVASAVEAPSSAVLTLHYVFMALGAIACIGGLIAYMQAD